MTSSGGAATMVRILEYRDPVENCPGFLVYDRTDCRLAAGGCRLSPGLSVDTLRELAARMTLKQRVLGLNVDGAKCGLAYDPAGPRRDAVLRRFLTFLAEELRTRFSMGADMGTRFETLDRLAAAVGAGSAKSAVRTAQYLTEEDFRARMAVLAAPVGPLSVGDRRAGHALAFAALTAADLEGLRRDRMTVSIQGFGNLGRPAALALAEAGVRITAIADEHGCRVAGAGLDVAAMLARDISCPVPELPGGGRVLPREAVLDLPADVLILAGCADAVPAARAGELSAAVVAVGANCGLSEQAETALTRRGVTVVPDFIGGVGGSASMEALFGPRATPEPREVLDGVAGIMRELVGDVLAGARERRLPTRQVALDMAQASMVDPDERPYGSCPYRVTVPAPSGRRGRTTSAHPGSVSTMTTTSTAAGRDSSAGPDLPGPSGPSDLSGDCGHTRGHITDSRFYGHNYGTESSRRVFCDRCRFQRWLDVEAALALSEADLGIIPKPAAEAIARAARAELLDLDGVRAEIRRTSHSLVAFLRAFQAVCEDGAGEFVHYGATTQDIQDTAQSLEMRDVLDELTVLVRHMLDRLAELAEENAESVCLGRTHAQPALPMGFGLKISGWIDELLRHLERIEQMRPRVLVAQLFGGVGTMAGFGEQALPLLEAFALRLGLAAPAIGWHVSRDRVAEYVTGLAMVAGTLGRIADEIRLLSRPEFGEVELGWRYGQVGSSTMPHKRNPEACEHAVVMARLAASQVANAMACLGGDNERDSRTLRIEWACVPDVSHFTLSACELVTRVLDGLAVRAERLRENVGDVAEQVATERLMLVLGQTMGKQSAHHFVYELAQTARQEGGSLRESLRSRTELAEDELDRIFDPAGYLGQSAALTGRVVARARAVLAVPAASVSSAAPVASAAPAADGSRGPAGPVEPGGAAGSTDPVVLGGPS
ncbi:adenylosuccinate lyase/glutamate dehydrogenase/leucine dehydrogenase [Catenulispora sp. MAP5-51]